MYNVENKKPYVATYKEIVIGFVTFALILIILYPKDMLQQQVLSEEANYDLSMLYLQNMLKNDPDNEELMYNLAKQSLKGKNRDLAYRLLKLLRKSKDRLIREEAYHLSYKILKENYYYLLQQGKKDEASKLLEEMRQLNHYIALHTTETDALEKLYNESIFLEDKLTAYYTLQKILQKKASLEHLRSAYYLANELHRYDAALRYLDLLIEKDKEHQEEWKNAKYYTLYNHKSPKVAQKFLEKEAKRSQQWKEKLAAFYLTQKRYKASAQSYMELFSQTKDHKLRQKYWLKALEVLQAGNYLQEACELGSKYQKEFLESKRVRLYLLKLYLAANDLQRANELATDILKLKEEKQ